jgi:preprotein translocase subunit SecB
LVLIEPSCASLAEKTLLFVKSPELLPFARQTCIDLLIMGNIPAI